MPIYEYTCSQCQKTSDVLQKLSEPTPEHCPACGAEGTLSRVVSRTSFVLKGGGWGADLYASKKAEAAPADAAKTPDKSAAPAAGATATPAAAPATGGTSSSGAPASAPAPTSTAGKKDSGT
jgi:putative FmdB family regulatory protein